MPFKANEFPHLKTTELCSTSGDGNNGIAFQIEWLLTDFDTMRSVLHFLKNARTGDDPDDPVEILITLLPNHAKRIDAYVAKEVKAKLLTEQQLAQEPTEDDDDE